jgi:hypothetical protein
MRNRLQVQLFLLDNLIWVIVLLFFLINAFVTPKFATYDNLVNIFYHSAIMSMLVLAQGLVMIIGHLDLSIESTLAFAPGIAMLLALKWIPGGLDPVTCIFLTLAVGALVGFFNGFCIAKIGVNPFLQSLSMLIMLRGLVLFLVPFSIFPLDKVYVYAGQTSIDGSHIDSQHFPPFLGRVNRGENSHAGTEKHRASYSLERPESYEGLDRPGHATEQGCEGEHGNTCNKNLFPADNVGIPSKGQQERRRSEKIAGDNPAQEQGAAVELFPDGRYSQVHSATHKRC